MRALLIGAGPSIDDNLIELKRLGGFSGITLCTDGAINKYLEAGFTPEYVTTLEDTVDLNKYYLTDTVKNHEGEIKGYISDRVHAEVRKAMKQARIQPHVAGDIREYVTSNVGLFSWLLAFRTFKCNEIYMIGMDHCYGPLEKPKVPRESKLFEVAFKVRINPYTNEEVILHPAYELWTEEFEWYIQKYPKTKTINMTGRGALYDKRIKWSPITQMKTL